MSHQHEIRGYKRIFEKALGSLKRDQEKKPEGYSIGAPGYYAVYSHSLSHVGEHVQLVA